MRAIAEIFRDADVLRQSREQARLKFLFLKQGWNAETFLSEIARGGGMVSTMIELRVCVKLGMTRADLAV